jgi:hypothetical protein
VFVYHLHLLTSPAAGSLLPFTSVHAMDCKGDGLCMEQTDSDDEETGLVMNPACPHGCRPLRCANFELCGMWVPQIILDTYSGRCLTCDIIFGTLVITDVDSQECTVCREEVTRLVKMVCCEHRFCCVCMRKLHWTDHDTQPDGEGDRIQTTPRCPLCREITRAPWQVRQS